MGSSLHRLFTFELVSDSDSMFPEITHVFISAAGRKCFILLVAHSVCSSSKHVRTITQHLNMDFNITAAVNSRLSQTLSNISGLNKKSFLKFSVHVLSKAASA